VEKKIQIVAYLDSSSSLRVSAPPVNVFEKCQLQSRNFSRDVVSAYCLGSYHPSSNNNTLLDSIAVAVNCVSFSMVKASPLVKRCSPICTAPLAT
jgi:hypothetical protein